MISMFSTAQLMVLIIFAELLVWDLISKVLSTIKHCSTSKAYRKFLEKGYTVDNETLNKIEKEIGNEIKRMG